MIFGAVYLDLPRDPLGLSTERAVMAVVFMRQKGRPDHSGDRYVHVRLRAASYCGVG